MAFLVCHMQKLGSGSLGGIQSHNERERESKSNTDIDYSKTEQNYSLVECESYRKAIKANIDELGLKKAIRKDAVLACSFVVTSSQDFFKSKSSEEQKAFFQDTVKFFQERYGEKNVFSAKVHMDEATPHMHLLLTPIRDNKLSAKAIFDKKELRGLQTDLHAFVGCSRGLKRGIENSDRAHLSENRFKAEKALERAKEAESRLEQAQTHLDELTPQLLTAEKAAKIAEKGKKTLFGNLKGVSITEFESLARTAKQVQDVQKRNDILISATNKMQTQVDGTQKWVAEQKNSLELEWKKLAEYKNSLDSEMRKTPSNSLREHNDELLARNRFLEKLLYQVRMSFRQLLPKVERESLRETLMHIDKAIKAGLEPEKERGFER